MQWASAWSGLSRMAVRYSATASSTSPGPIRALAEVVVGLGVVGPEPDGGAVCGDGLVLLPLAAQGDAEVVVGLGVVGLEPDGGAVSAMASSTSPGPPGRCRG